MLLARLLSRVIRIGRLELIDAAGRQYLFGGLPGPSVSVRLHDPALHWKFIINPRLNVPEAYMNGTLTIENGGLYELLELLTRNDVAMYDHAIWRLRARAARITRRLHQYNPAARSRRNVAHHYDLSDELYELFLDRDRQYSCAYFLSPDDDIDTAQLNKRRHIAAKLLLRPGMKVLDVGSGWGRACALSGKRVRRRRDRPDPVDRAAQSRATSRRRGRADRSRAFPLARLPRGGRAVRSHRLGWHVRARRGRAHGDIL